MRLAWIVPGFQASADDRCIPALTDLAHRVAERHDLTVFALQYPGRENAYKVGQVKIRSFRPGPPSAIPKLRQLGPFWRAYQSVQSEDRRQPFELLQAFWAAEPALLAGWVRPGLAKQPPLVVSLMGGEVAALPEIGYGAVLRRLDRFYLGQAIRQADCLTTGSQTLANLLKARYPILQIENKQVKILPLGVDTARFIPVLAPAIECTQAEAINILTVGSLLPVKGHANLLKAFVQVLQARPDLNLKLRIVGQGGCKLELEKFVSDAGLTERVTLAGSVPPEQMPGEYQKADLFVLPSYYESQCVALCEALASGLPIASAPVGLAPELIASASRESKNESKIGELAESNQPSALAAALLRLLQRRHQWPTMSQAARQLAEEQLSLEICTERFLKVYETQRHEQIREQVKA